MYKYTLLSLLFACEVVEKEEATDTGTAELLDSDGDGFGIDDDCDDSDPSIHPQAEEICDGIDQNCDSLIDNDAVDASTFYQDSDNDAFGDASNPQSSCEVPEGFVDNMDDCDDTNPEIHPGIDGDGDGFHICEDCNDTDNSIHPDALEEWYDGIDQNCDEWSDYDADMDGYDSAHIEEYIETEYDPITGEVISEGDYFEYWSAGPDCNDSDEWIHPLPSEVNPDACYVDKDEDGYGDDEPDWSYYASLPPDQELSEGTDCDDDDGYTFPGAAFNEFFPLNEQCLTDTDQDGYGMSVEGIFAEKTTSGTCYALTIDSVGSGCRAYLDIYENGVLITSYESPSAGSVRYDECSVEGYLQVGWTQDDIFDNGGCHLTIEDENGSILYRSTEYERSYIPQGGTDPNDGDASVY